MSGLNWPGLMAWSTKYHDGTKPSEFKMMSDEDKGFLQKAMEEAMSHIEDPNEVFKEAIEQVGQEGAVDELVLTALEIVDRCCDDPDVARNVEKLGGIQTLLDAASSRGEAVGVRSMEMLAMFFSNNPSIQEVGVKREGIDVLLRVFRESPIGSDRRSKAFRTLATLVRGIPDYESRFMSDGGVAVVVECLSLAEDARLREKAANFAGYLAAEGRLNVIDCVSIAPTLVPLLADAAEQQIQYRETVAQCACDLLRATAPNCPSELVDGVQARLAQVVSGQNPDEETECALLQECIRSAAGTGESRAQPAGLALPALPAPRPVMPALL